MKSTQQLLQERDEIFFKYIAKKCEGVYAIINREERLRKSELWQKYLKRRYEEIDNKIQFNSDLLATVNKKN